MKLLRLISHGLYAVVEVGKENWKVTKVIDAYKVPDRLLEEYFDNERAKNKKRQSYLTDSSDLLD